MTQDLSALSLESLQQLYAEEDARLASSLLKGASWEELRELRIVVTCLAKEIHHRKFPIKSTPADTPFRFNY
jgi:hypothetical protein